MFAAETQGATERAVRIRPGSGWADTNMQELWRFRDLFRTLAARDIKVRYKQTVLGASWVVIQPLFAAGIFSFVFGSIADFEAPGGAPYFLFSFVGLVAWTLFSSALAKVSNSMVGNAHLVSKVYFPRLILPLSTAAAAVVDFLVVMGMVVVMLLVFWEFPGAAALMLPISVVLLLLLGVGIGLWATALAVSYRDVIHIVPVAVQFLLYASPVAYAVSEVPDRYQSLYYLNPLAALLETFRWSVLGAGEFRPGWLAYSGLCAVGVFFVGAFAFRRMERKFADVI